MNRRQQERVADLGRAFQSSLEEIIDMNGEEISNGLEEVNQEQPIPMPADMNGKLASHHVNIRHVHNGFIVEVGCQTFVFETYDKLSKYMKMYYDDPQGTYEKHYSGKLFGK